MRELSVERSSISPASPQHLSRDPSGGLLGFIALAWVSTWLLTGPFVYSRVSGAPAQPYMFAMAGLSAFGPTFAALIMAQRHGGVRGVLSGFRTRAGWLVFGLSAPLALHLVARLLEVALGGDVERWFWLPRNPAEVAALVVFPIGEELGWRGFAHPRLVQRHGAVLGSLVLGGIWAIWHLLYVVTPSGNIELLPFVGMAIELMCWSVIIAWFFERTDRSLLVAIAIHAGAHLDNSAQISAEQGRLRLLMLLVLVVAATMAARALRTGRPHPPPDVARR